MTVSSWKRKAIRDIGENVSELEIRYAQAEDSAAINGVYNHYVETSTATFETKSKSLEERRDWVLAHGGRFPAIVAEKDGEVVGWGSLSEWSLRPAWSATAEVSVYVATGLTGAGVGPVILSRLVDEARRHGHHALIAQIVGENGPSLKMSERAGFERVGTLREVGYKFDRWLDVVLVELVL